MSGLDETGSSDGDRAFQRLLVRAAGDDAPPSGSAAAAWATFARAGGALGVGMGVDPTRAAGTAVRRSALVSAGAWVGAGALIGSAVTLAVLWSGAPSAGTHSPPEASSISTTGATVGPAATVAVSSPPRSIEGTQTAPAFSQEPTEQGGNGNPLPRGVGAPSSATPGAEPHSAAATTGEEQRAANSGAPGPSGRSHADADSTLLREVLALDEIRAALARGAFDEALRRVESFHRDFPKAQLGADAEALGVRALVDKHEDAAATERAERFLARYPNDPHAERVQPHKEQR